MKSSLNSIIGTVFARLGGILIGFMSLLFVIDIILRRFFNRPLSWTYEIFELMLLLVFFIATVVASVDGRHVSIDMLTSQFGSGLRKTVLKITDLITILFLLLIGSRGVIDGLQSSKINDTTGALGIPYYPFYFLMAFCLTVAGLVMLVGLFKRRSKGNR